MLLLMQSITVPGRVAPPNRMAPSGGRLRHRLFFQASPPGALLQYNISAAHPSGRLVVIGSPPKAASNAMLAV